jgi:hypothetical protein
MAVYLSDDGCSEEEKAIQRRFARCVPAPKVSFRYLLQREPKGDEEASQVTSLRVQLYRPFSTSTLNVCFFLLIALDVIGVDRMRSRQLIWRSHQRSIFNLYIYISKS